MLKYPIYIPSKRRSEPALTADILKQENIPYTLVIEPQEEKAYQAKYPGRCILLDKNDAGIAYARSWIKRYSKNQKESFHWQLDDNIKDFLIRKKNANKKSTAMYNMSFLEQTCDQYINIGLAGLIHNMFAFSHTQEIGINKQVYTCILVNNALNIFWRKGVVEDTDYSIQVLMYQRRLWCTLAFHRLLIVKPVTMAMKGGCTELEYGPNSTYGGDGRKARAKGLQKMWPGWFKTTYQYDRVKMLPSQIWRQFKQRPILKQ